MLELFNSKLVKDLQEGKLPTVQVEAVIATESIINMVIAASFVVVLFFALSVMMKK